MIARYYVTPQGITKMVCDIQGVFVLSQCDQRKLKYLYEAGHRKYIAKEEAGESKPAPTRKGKDD